MSGLDHYLNAPYHPMTNGLVEHQNYTTEDCIRKVIENDNDWYNVLDSVLFACHIATHSSTGVSPYCMVFNKDLILPFKYKDKLDFHSDDYLDDESSLIAPNGCTQANSININQEFSQTLEEMEKQKQEIFSHANVVLFSQCYHNMTWISSEFYYSHGYGKTQTVGVS